MSERDLQSEDRTSYLGGLRRMMRHLPARRRKQGVLVLACMFVVATAELLTLGAILPFLAVIADPNALDRIPMLKSLLALLGADGPRETVLVLALLFGTVAVTTAVIRIGMTWLSQKYVFRLGHDLSMLVYQRVLYQPYTFHTSTSTSRIISSVNMVQQVVFGVLLPIMQGLTALLVSVFILTGLMLVSIEAALGSALAFGVIYLGVSALTRAQLSRNGRIIARNNTARLKTIQEGLGGIRDVIIDRAQPVYLRTFSQLDSRIRDAQAANAMMGATPRFVLEGLGMALIALLTLQLSGGKGGLQAALPILGALAMGAQRLLPLLQQIYNSWSVILANRAQLLDVLELVEKPLPPHATPGAEHPLVPFEKSIRLQDVSFRYSADAPTILENVNLEIRRSSRVGFIGRTGSGKSTIIDLIMGLLPPSSGQLLVDDMAVQAETMPGWWAQISHVPQAIYLADATIIENIAFGIDRDKIDEARAREAARQAGIDEFILSRKGGYDTIVGERGIQLSGGQRQRIGLARALYRQCSVLIFDEATNALDQETEDTIMQSIDSLNSEMTVLIVAHRLSTLKNCDVIFRIEDGRIAAQGTYEQVVLAAA